MMMTDPAQQFLCRTIYLIDSFWPGKLLELNNQGNIKVAGTNGAGKTTLLKLPMLFWGARPGRIVERNANKKSFAAYYLPRKTSYIVFDYQRPNGSDTPQLCHILIKSDGEKLNYRFIDHPFEADMYLDESGNIFSDEEIKRNYRNTHRCEISTLLSVDDYAKVIQNHRDLGGKKHLRKLQQRFSMSKAPIKHIEKVVTSVFNKISNFDVIKQMIIEISQDAISSDMLSCGVDDMVNINKSDIENWLSDLHSSQVVLDLEEKILTSMESIDSLVEIQKELEHLHYLAKLYHEKCVQEQSQSQQKITEIEQEQQIEKEEHRSKLEVLDDELEQNQSQQRRKKTAIDTIEQQKIDYEDDEAATYEQRGAEVSTLNLRLIDLTNEQAQLNQKSAILSRLFAEQKQKQELEFNRQEQDLTGKIGSQQQEMNTELSKNELHYTLLENELTANHQIQLNKFVEKRTPLEHAKISLDLQLQQPQLDPLLQQKADALQFDLRNTRRKISELQDDFNKQSSQSQALRNKQQHELQQNERLKIELSRLAQQHREVQALLKPEPGSLHAFLIEHVPHWQTSIGRVINPELLKNPHLEPELATTDLTELKEQFNHLYGIQINLTALTDGSFTDETLTQKEQHISEQIAQKNAANIELEKQLEQINLDVEELDKQLNSTKQLLIKQNQVLANLIDEEDELNAKIDQFKALFIERITQEQSATEVKLSKIDQEIGQEKIDHQDRKDALNDERLSSHCQIETDFNQRIDNYQDSLDKLRIDSLQELKRIDDALQAALSEAGINRTIFNALEEKISSTQEAIEIAKQFQKKALEYQEWLTTCWIHIEPERAHLRRLEENIRSLTNRKNDRLSQHKQRSDKLKQDLTRHEKLSQDLNNQIKGLRSSIERLDLFTCVEHSDLPDYSVNNITKLTKTQYTKLTQLIKQVSEMRRELNTQLNKYNGSTLHNGWLEHHIALSEENKDSTLTEAINSKAQFDYVLKNAKLLQTSTTHEVELRANDIHSIYTHLSNFDRNISRTGRKLSNHMSGKQFFSALGDISIAIKTKMDKLGYWQQLENVEEAFTTYQATIERCQDRSIPQELIDALDELSVALPKSSSIMQHNELFDIEFTIVENGRITRATTPKELEDVSSTGLSYLALITFFTGLTSMLRADKNTVITWPVDELGELHAENIQAMLSMLNQNGVQIMTASPSTDKSVLQLFDHLYEIDNTNKRLIQMNVDDDPLAALLNATDANLENSTLVHSEEA